MNIESAVSPDRTGPDTEILIEGARYIEISAPEFDGDGHTMIRVSRFGPIAKQIAYLDRCLSLVGKYKMGEHIVVVDGRLLVRIECDSDLFSNDALLRGQIARVIHAVESTAELISSKTRVNESITEDELLVIAETLPLRVEPEQLKELAIDAISIDWSKAKGVLLLPRLDGTDAAFSLPAQENLKPAKEPSVLREHFCGTVIAHYAEVGLLLFSDGSIGNIVEGQNMSSIQRGQKIHGPIFDKRGTLTFRIFSGPIEASLEKPVFTSVSDGSTSSKPVLASTRSSVSRNSLSPAKPRTTAIAKYKSRTPQRKSPKAKSP